MFQNQSELTLSPIPSGIVPESDLEMASWVQTRQVVEELDACLDRAILPETDLERFDIVLGEHVLYCPI
jgi:hypothetical protein